MLPPASTAVRRSVVCSSGLPSLDACLPDGGWPCGGVIELIHAQRSKQTTGVRAWQANTALLLPALKSIQMQPDAASGAVRPWVAWVGPGLAPPGHDGVRTQPFTPTWAAQGVDIRRFVWVSAPEQARDAMDNAWAAEQLLRCQDVGAVVVYGLPESTQTSQILRRLQ